jgi:hypothetical protein
MIEYILNIQNQQEKNNQAWLKKLEIKDFQEV